MRASSRSLAATPKGLFDAGDNAAVHETVHPVLLAIFIFSPLSLCFFFFFFEVTLFALNDARFRAG